ncbi:MAG: VacJ family lipoprotein [Silicimonas sp.]|nr:VacJ family lipoprotein [Silicimonas sp.]
MLIAAISGCSTPENPGDIHDPYERINRVSHAVNKGADRVFFKPASEGYGSIVPKPVRSSLSNVASYLDTPRTVMNDVLQGNIENAGHSTFRFVINSTIGVFGLFDPATSDFGLEERETGFADTLAVWGAPAGAYLELPLFGPSTERDATGLAADILANPLSVFSDHGTELAAATSFPSVLNSRHEFGDTVDSILYESADSYAQLRLYYLDSRQFELSGQTSAENAFAPYEDLYEEVYEGLYDGF